MKNLYFLLLILIFFANNLSAQVITSPNPVICGSNTNAVLTASSGSTYQWSFCATEFGTYTNISGATSSSHTTTTLGFYKVSVNSVLSPAFRVSNVPYANLTNSSGNTSDVLLQTGQTENLKVDLKGIGPWTFSLVDNNSAKYYSSTSNLATIPISPTFAARYSIYQASNNCGVSGYSNSILVKINPEPVSITLPIPANTSVCKGSTLEIPYTLNGNWPATTTVLSMSLSGSGGSVYGGTCYNGTCKINVPSTFASGLYTYSLNSNYPNYYITGSQQITVINNTASCPIRQTYIIGQQGCSFAYLQANNRGESGFTYRWYKDGNLLTGLTGDNYGISENGSYTLNIQNATTGYNQTSAPYIINSLTGIKPIITSNDFVCGNNTSVTLNNNLVSNGYTYQWFKTNSNNVTLPIAGATGSTLTTNEFSNYSIKVRVSENCEYTSNAFTLPTTRTATLTNASFNNNDVNINPTESTNLKVTYNGSGPIELSLYGGDYLRKYIATSSPFTIPVTPVASAQYYLGSQNYDNCEVNLNTVGSVIVNVGTPTITLPTPPITTVCAGGTFEIPFSISGNWGDANNRLIYVHLSTQSNVFVSGSTIGSFNNPIQYRVPSTVTPGIYKLNVSPGYPYLPRQIPYNIEVTANNAACPAPTASLEGSSQSCGSSSLRAYPQGTGYTYQWFKNNVLIAGAVNNNYYPTVAGSYKVQIINTSTNYDVTTQEKSITINIVVPNITSPNSVLCGTNTSATLSTSYTGSGYIYQWYKVRYHGQYYIQQAPIYGAINPTYSTSSVGEYYVSVWDGNCQFTSDRFLVTDKSQAKLTNLAGDNTAVTIGGATTSATLRVTFTGGGPWSFNLVGSDGNTTAYTNVATQVYDFTVSPVANTNYSIANLTSSCGVGTSTGSLTVIVSPPPSFIVNTPSSFDKSGGVKNPLGTNICPGSTISVGYTIAGNWSVDRDMVVEMVNSSTNAVIAGTTQRGYNTNPILYFVPYNVPVGTYKLKLTSTKPFIESGVLSSIVTVTNTACNTPQATVRSKTSCSSSLLSATPSGSGFTYQWYNGATLIPNATSSDYNATADGSYTVAIANATQGYSATSAAYVVAIEEINSAITASSGSICNAGGSVTFTSNNVGGSYTHQWYSSTDNVFFVPISGATVNTYSTTTAGYYNAIIKNAGCELKSSTLNTCVASLNFSAKTVCVNSGVSLPFTFSGGENQAIIIQLIDATTNAVVQANLLTLTSTNATSYNPTVNIPNTVTAGTYKFKLITTTPNNLSLIGTGVLTISNQTGGIAPIVSASANSVSSVQNVTITAIGCVGDVLWNNSDQIPQSFPTFSSTVNKNTTYSVTCKDVSTGCISTEGSTTVTYSCTDAYEPNNSTMTATPLASYSFVSPVICLNGFDNPDWFTWTLGGHIYYIKAALASNQVSAGSYKLGLTYAGSVLTIETLPETVGQSLDTYLTFFDSDGITLLSSDDNGNANGFSKISIGIIPPAICLLNESLMTGNWGTAGTWSCGHIPLATEPVQISSGHTITLDVNGAAKSLDLRGILNKQATKILTIQGN